MKACGQIVSQSECGMDTEVVVRLFLTNSKNLRRLTDYCRGSEPSFSVKADRNKTDDFHSFKALTATKKQIANGVEMFSPTQSENLRTSLRALGHNLDDLI